MVGMWTKKYLEKETMFRIAVAPLPPNDAHASKSVYLLGSMQNLSYCARNDLVDNICITYNERAAK